MPQVLPFKGYRFDSSLCGDMARLIAPPYDVIDDATRETLHRQSEFNIAHVTKAIRNEQAPSGNPYEEAGARWQQWLDRGYVKRDEQAAIYVYEQHFEIHGHRLSRTAMIAAIELEKPGRGVVPHENTLLGPRTDRLHLMRATAMQFGLVFGLYPDAAGSIDALLERARKGRPLVQAADRQDLLHRLWALTDAESVAQIGALMRDKPLLIADGHHRYETSLAYVAEHPEMPAARYRMLAMVNMSNPGLVVLPIHRLVRNLGNFAPEEFLAALRKHFDVKSYPGSAAAVRDAAVAAARELQAEGRHAFALLMNDGNYRVVTLRDESAMDFLKDRSPDYRKLDVTILHTLILEQLMGITPERLQTESNIDYVHDFPYAIDQATERVHSGQCQALFLLNPTRVEEVAAVAGHQERMPQKSTFFYPKMYTGLVTYRMDPSGPSIL